MDRLKLVSVLCIIALLWGTIRYTVAKPDVFEPALVGVAETSDEEQQVKEVVVEQFAVPMTAEISSFSDRDSFPVTSVLGMDIEDDGLTDSYRAARELFMDFTGILLPSVEGLEVECRYDLQYESIVIELSGDLNMFSVFSGGIKEYLGKPDYKDKYNSSWEILISAGEAFYDVLYYYDDPMDPKVYVSYHIEYNSEE